MAYPATVHYAPRNIRRRPQMVEAVVKCGSCGLTNVRLPRTTVRKLRDGVRCPNPRCGGRVKRVDERRQFRTAS